MLVLVELNRKRMGKSLTFSSQRAKSEDSNRAGSHNRSAHKAGRAVYVTSGQHFFFLSICKGNKMLRAGRIPHMYNGAINFTAQSLS